MKMMERVLEELFYKVVTDKKIQFCFMAEKGTIDAVFILRRLQEKRERHQYLKFGSFPNK